ncbi:D-alanyl-D-alanine carboxypeptidase/D-alanyl-D-alanine-endopeptidase [Planosporangium thailandense]|uniref:D-alanyl-D-alanine carboxypeptidase/D-alanyl-D-alanine-endopeptidase n=1 Tax=Planosporangium thailandense TaxID=765197 RepID=A0ABX0XT48_9ACTN|nr:D-alanyl-D-alanine carboxypeptidase/D-alanyl-D-alanine-endopeptidase [Planosporangium thailandense]NJC69181.1 D-alanyl-D-alanine carboxypeptidase/D-alanyl-D-alanine-endopeptidase [Planosporangium thailandense]
MARQRPQLLRRLIVTVVCLLSAVLAAAGTAAFAPDAGAQLIGAPSRTWHAGAPAVPAPPVLAGAGSAAAAPDPAAVAASLAPLLRDPVLGGHLDAYVADAVTGAQLFAENPDTAALPASTLKLLTAEAVLTARGPAYRLATRAVAGANPGEVVLVGGGDPTLAGGERRTFAEAARLDELAAQVKKALGGTAPTRVIIDASLFGPATTGPGWDSDIISSGNSSVISSLMIDGGRSAPTSPHGPSPRAAAPDLAAGQAFAAALGLPASAVTAGTAPTGAAQLGVVESPPLERLVELMLVESDNVIAECLARQVALARSQPATFEGAATAMRAVLGELGLPVDKLVLSDGSGLSRNDRVTPTLLAGALLLAVKPTHPQLRVVFSGMPVGGYSGTLRDRYRKPTNGAAAAGLVRAKTGSLSGLNSIAGTVVDADGRLLVFAVIADASPNLGGIPSPPQQALDRVAAALAGCGCH